MPQIDVDAAPSGDGCADCEEVGGWWLHLRRCAVRSRGLLRLVAASSRVHARGDGRSPVRPEL
jgi:hypothetical protein